MCKLTKMFSKIYGLVVYVVTRYEYVGQNSDADCEYHGLDVRLHKPHYDKV